MRYFNYGSVQLTDDQSNDQGTYTPNEFFDRWFHLPVNWRKSLLRINTAVYTFKHYQVSLLHKDREQVNNQVTRLPQMYHYSTKKPYGSNNLFAFGAHISNIVTKIGYSDVGPKILFTNQLKLGVANTWELDETNETDRHF